MTTYKDVKAWREKQPNIRELRAEEARKWRSAHPDIAKAIKQRYKEKHRAEILPREAEQARKRRAADPEGSRRRMAMFLERKRQERIAIAGRPMPDVCEVCGEFHLRIVFDHCHTKGHFRGWICDRCNKVLGLIKDSTELLMLLHQYLAKDNL
jgi:hypothetical protein